jgi:mannose-1-phosphate guanylyltransferase
VDAFKEKPDLETAKEYLEDGGYLWNAGIFIWRAESILNAFEKHATQIYETLTVDVSKFGTREEQAYIDKQYPLTDKISVDYAIMEKSNAVYSIPADIGWSDLGTWNSLHALLDKDVNDNVHLGQSIMGASKNSLIKTVGDKLVVVEGLEDFIVIDEEDVLLIWPKEREQEIKELRNEVEKRYLGKYL